VVKTTTSAIEIDSFGVIHNTFKTRSAFKTVYILEQANTIRQILHGKKAPIMVDVLKVEKIKLSLYSKLFHNTNLENASAIAVLVKSGLQKKILNFWYRGKSQSCPLMVFTSKEEANIWLQAHV
jgi:hypothetical protein